MKINDTGLHLKRVTCGVPQGSVLGPKLFVIPLSDICTVTDTSIFTMFADDTILYCSEGNIQTYF